MTECIFGWGKQHGTMRKTIRPRVARDRLQSAGDGKMRVHYSAIGKRANVDALPT